MIKDIPMDQERQRRYIQTKKGQRGCIRQESTTEIYFTSLRGDSLKISYIYACAPFSNFILFHSSSIYFLFSQFECSVCPAHILARSIFRIWFCLHPFFCLVFWLSGGVSWRAPFQRIGCVGHTAAHCNTLQHTAIHCNTLQHTAIHCNTLQHSSPVVDGLCWALAFILNSHVVQFTATHCNTLQHICHTRTLSCIPSNRNAQFSGGGWAATNTSVNSQFSCNTLHCNTLQHTATHCDTLQHTATHCNTL